VVFLEHLIRHLPNKLLVNWDRASIHRCKAVKQFLTDGGAERIWRERLPAYAPDLNPDEGIWQYLKYVELRNVVCADLEELRYELRLAVARVRHQPDVIPGCIAQAGLTI
jgi:transposase